MLPLLLVTEEEMKLRSQVSGVMQKHHVNSKAYLPHLPHETTYGKSHLSWTSCQE